MTIIKKTVTSGGEDMEKLEPLYTAGVNLKWCAWESILAVPEGVEHGAVMWASSSTSRHLFQRNGIVSKPLW